MWSFDWFKTPWWRKRFGVFKEVFGHGVDTAGIVTIFAAGVWYAERFPGANAESLKTFEHKIFVLIILIQSARLVWYFVGDFVKQLPIGKYFKNAP